MPYFICPNCGNRELSGERTAGFSTRPKGCSKCGFGFLFELLDDYMPAPGAAFFTCDQEGKILDLGKGAFELTGLKDEQVIGRPVRDVLGLQWIEKADGAPDRRHRRKWRYRSDRDDAGVGGALAGEEGGRERGGRPAYGGGG